MVMEPKYFAFWTWFFCSPKSSSDVLMHQDPIRDTEFSTLFGGEMWNLYIYLGKFL